MSDCSHRCVPRSRALIFKAGQIKIGCAKRLPNEGVTILAVIVIRHGTLCLSDSDTGYYVDYNSFVDV